MGSYGIGPARIVAAAIEQGADERGIVWPPALAPWQVHLVGWARSRTTTKPAAADRIYEELVEAGAEVLYDDRDAGPGEKLTDAELLGCPLAPHGRQAHPGRRQGRGTGPALRGGQQARRSRGDGAGARAALGPWLKNR